MKKSKLFSFIASSILLIGSLSSCNFLINSSLSNDSTSSQSGESSSSLPSIDVKGTFKKDNLELTVGESIYLNDLVTLENIIFNDVIFLSEDITIASIEDNYLIGKSEGTTSISLLTKDSILLDTISINVSEEILSLTIEVSDDNLNLGEEAYVSIIDSSIDIDKVEIYEVTDDEVVLIENNKVIAYQAGTTIIEASYLGINSNQITIKVNDKDPYENIDEDAFYDNYSPSKNSIDAALRSEHYLMSGDIVTPECVPLISSNQPKDGNYLLRNSSSLFSENGDTYYLLDEKGNIVNEIYKDGAYITLEEVASYVYAFGDIPCNYSSSKSVSPSRSNWGEYLRLNNSEFSGNTNKYPYEPSLPRIEGNGGDLIYYEIDIGTTGTDTGSGYDVRIYNDGKKITRGAARIVYSRYYDDGTKITDLEDRYVFYTYNHYNDFQEYLNYQNGWGGIFGNITGGSYQDEYDPHNPPTEYINVKREDFLTF